MPDGDDENGGAPRPCIRPEGDDAKGGRPGTVPVEGELVNPPPVEVTLDGEDENGGRSAEVTLDGDDEKGGFSAAVMPEPDDEKGGWPPVGAGRRGG